MRSTQTGLTLVELMIAVGIVIILSAIAVPKVFQVLDHNTIATSSNLFVQSLHLARSEAIRGGTSTLCASTDQATCSANAADWNQGWILQDAQGNVVRVFGALPGTIAVTAPSASITYQSNGFLSPPAQLVVFFCNTRNKTNNTSVSNGNQVTINANGRPMSKRVTGTVCA